MNKLFLENILLGTVLFGRFRLVHLLHADDLLGVYLCADTRARDKLCVLKVYVTPMLHEHNLRTGVQHELDIARRVHHQNVVRYEQIFEDEEFTALHMEYCPGGALSDQMAPKTRFTFDHLVGVLSQLALGLEAVHKAGILHRDLKPENILTSERGILKISDFGIATIQGDEFEGQHEMIPGTVHYMSPECVAVGEFTPASDIYALGMLAYHMLCGRFPFEGTDVVELLAARILKDPPALVQFRTDCPATIEEIVMKAVARRPENRYQQCAELLHDLGKLSIERRQKGMRLVA